MAYTLTPVTRLEKFLNKIATGSGDLSPIRRLEYWLNKIATKIKGNSDDISSLDTRVTALEESGGGMILPLEVLVDTSGPSPVITLTDPASAFTLDTIYNTIVTDSAVVTWDIHTIIDNETELYSQVTGGTITSERVDNYNVYDCTITYIIGDRVCYEIVLEQDDMTFVWNNSVNSYTLDVA